MARVEDWTAVVPVKETARAKTRLTPDPARRQRLALAFACDTVAALTRALRVAHVVVVTDDGREYLSEPQTRLYLIPSP